MSISLVNADTNDIVRGTIVLVVFALLIGWFIFWTIQKADEPKLMVVKWICTGIALYLLLGVAGRMVAAGGYGAAFVGLPLTAVCGIALTIIWRRTIAELAAKPFTALYDGGSTPPDPVPLYSVARARQKRGDYHEAIAEVRKQLDRFPTDVEGQLLVAEIQAEGLKDLPAAELTIERFITQPNHAPKNIAFALYSMADWHLAIGQDPEAAQRALQKIIDRLPGTEFALGAAQRIAHMASPDMLIELHEGRKYAVPHADQHLGITMSRGPTVIEPTPSELADRYVRHLEQHPLDAEAREKLAAIYADHYQRLDLATDQLEQLIAVPQQPAKSVVRWLNMMADLQIRCGASLEEVAATIQRIIDRDPGSAAAALARQRLGLLKLEFKSKEKSQAVKLGSYEQDIGLKRGLPRHQP